MPSRASQYSLSEIFQDQRKLDHWQSGGTDSDEETSATWDAHMAAMAFKEYARELETRLELSNAHVTVLADRVQVLELHRLLLALCAALAVPAAAMAILGHALDLETWEPGPIALGLWASILVGLLALFFRLLLRARAAATTTGPRLQRRKSSAVELVRRVTADPHASIESHETQMRESSSRLRKRRTVSKLSV